MKNSLDPDETAHSKPSHQDLNCFQTGLICRAGSVKLLL